LNKALFLHIPKTGGTSAINYFSSCLGLENIYQTATCEFFNNDTTLANPLSLLIAGHGKFIDIQPALKFGYRIFSLFREPIDCCLSYYYYLKSDIVDIKLGALNPSVLDAKTLPLIEALSIQDHLDLSVFSNPITAQLSRLPPTASLSEHLQSATEALASLDAVGLFEEFEVSLRHICAVMGWPAKGKIEHLNKTAKRQAVADLDKKTLALLKKMNQADLELYALAKERFHSDLKAPIVSLPTAKPLVKFAALSHERTEIGSKDFSIEEVSFGGLGQGYHPFVSVPEGTRLVIRYKIHAAKPDPDLTIGIGITNAEGASVFGTNSHLLQKFIHLTQKGQDFYVSFTFDQNFLPGEYYVSATLHKGMAHTEGCYHWVENAAKFQVVRNEIRMVLSRQAGGVEFATSPHLQMAKLPQSVPGYVGLKVAHGPLLAATRHLWVLLENDSPHWLSSLGPFPVHISYRAFDNNATLLTADGLRSRLDPPLEPGGKRMYPFYIDSALPADCMLKVSLVQEGNFWFSQFNPEHADTFGEMAT
jgi:hypothetical protein